MADILQKTESATYSTFEVRIRALEMAERLEGPKALTREIIAQASSIVDFITHGTVPGVVPLPPDIPGETRPAALN